MTVVEVDESQEKSSASHHPTRRSVLMAGAAAGAIVGALALVKPAAARIVDVGLAKKTIVGYPWPWTARPGEKIEFKVSTYAPGDYQAELVRLICADGITDGGRHFKEERIAASFAGTYPGRNQPIYSGSFVHMGNTTQLDRLGSFTLAASVYPTRVTTGSQLAAAGFTPGLEKKGIGRAQHVISRWDDTTKTGWLLALDEQERIAFYTGDGSGEIDEIVLSRPPALRRWLRVWVTFDERSKRVTLAQEPVNHNPGDRVMRRPEQASGTASRLVQAGALRFGASVGGPGNGDMARAGAAFNGKLDTIRLMRGVLAEEQIRDLFVSATPKEQSAQAVGWWDFAKGTGTIHVHDISGHGLDGVTINLPERAVMGVNWDGTQLDWKSAPHHYGAIYFHDSAMIDAEWKTDFEFEVPEDLRSGVYAAKLRHGDAEDYIPFFVAPPKTRPKAKLALIVATFTYAAYANTIGASTYKREVLVKGEDGKERIDYEEWMPILKEEKSYFDMALEHWEDFGMGVYRFHSDGAPIRHAPMRIPNISNRPKALNRHLAADVDIVEWLEREGIEYDVITDELVHQEGLELLAGYTTLLTTSHTEYHTWDMFRAFMAYLDQGGRLMSIGGNGFHNVIACHAEVPGVIECRKRQGGSPSGHDPHFESFNEFDGRPGGRFRETGFPANVVHGVGTNYPHPMTAGTYYRRLPDADNPRARFVFENVQGDIIGNFGKCGGGAVAVECDAADYTDGTPSHALILARSENMVWPMVSEDGLTAPKWRTNFNPRSELVFFETPNGGAVFSVGSMAYVSSLSHNNFDNNVAQITKNVLERFMDSKPFPYPT